MVFFIQYVVLISFFVLVFAKNHFFVEKGLKLPNLRNLKKKSGAPLSKNAPRINPPREGRHMARGEEIRAEA